MKHNKWLFRLAAMGLSTTLLLTSISFPANAAETSTSTVDSVEIETAIPTEEDSTEEDSTEEDSTETTASETDTDSLSEIHSNGTAEEHHTITGFAPLSEDESSLHMSVTDKPSESDVIDVLPSSLDVYLDGGTKLETIPVTWKSVGDFDSTSLYYYEFDPVFNSDDYTLADDIQLPYIGIWLDSSDGISLLTADRSSISNTESTIFKYITADMGLNIAAASGILANIQAESGFNPNLYGDSGSSYGICQWHNDRFTALKNYTDKWDTLQGQLEYLHYELRTNYPNLWNSLKSAGNDANGAYQTAYNWCILFEKPANMYNMAISRGNLAKNTYWPKYAGTIIPSNDPVTISGASSPNTMTAGSSFDIRGTLSCGGTITSVTVGVYDTSGSMKIGKTTDPGTTTYDLKSLDTSIKFSTLPAGGYRYKVIATSDAGTVTLINKAFMVLSTGRTVADGIYQIANVQNKGYVLSVDGNKNVSGTNILLWTKAAIPYRQFQFIYQDNGYYKIKNIGSGLYLGAAGQSGTSGTNVEQSTNGTLWQVLPDDTGSYYLIPKCSSTSAMDLYTGVIKAGQNIEIWNYNLGKAQRWTLSTTLAKPVISGQTMPSTKTQGSAFDIRGIISSPEKMTSITVGVYDAAGKLQIGKTVSPNVTSYDLKNLDTDIKFSTLTPGGYKYQVTVSTASGTTVLISKLFMVLSANRTIADGTYQIANMQSGNYVLSIDKNKNTSGTNILLWTKANIAYRRFQISYQNNGYYKIKNEGSGLYLSVAGQSGNSGANVEQSSVGTLWQILPDGNGSYYIVPQTSSTSCLDLQTGVIAAGKNIALWNYNLGKAQRWHLLQASTPTQTTKATISGQTVPATMNQGHSFSIRGTISSGEKLSSVTVGVYDTNGKMRIGKTVSPNVSSYDLRNVDTAIKFSALTAGGYRYKVIANTASGTTVLINTAFMVLSSQRTVADGTYMISNIQNDNYSLSVDGNKNAAGTNILLWTKANIAYRKFQFIYQSNGYYRIKNVGSGLYLSVANNGSKAGSNVQLSSSASLWQVLPDGNGAYYLVPNCSSTCSLDLYTGVIGKGKNIDIWNYNLGKAQRWKLQ